MHANVTSPRHHHRPEESTFSFSSSLPSTCFRLHLGVLILLFVDMLLIGLLHYESLCPPLHWPSSIYLCLSLCCAHLLCRHPGDGLLNTTENMSWTENCSQHHSRKLYSVHYWPLHSLWHALVKREGWSFSGSISRYLFHRRSTLSIRHPNIPIHSWEQWGQQVYDVIEDGCGDQQEHQSFTSPFMYLSEWGANGPYTWLQLPTTLQLTLPLNTGALQRTKKELFRFYPVASASTHCFLVDLKR